MSTPIERALIDEVERTRKALNAVPWWRPLKRQGAAHDYRYALLAAALAEMDAEGK